MAKKKTQSKKTPQKTPRNAPKEQPQSRSRLSLIIAVLVVIILVVPLAIFWDDIITGIGNAVSSIWNTLEWGILFIALIILILGILFRQRQLSLLVHSWNLWLGVISVIMAGWGVLAFFDLGGSFGSAIIGQSSLGGYI